MKQQCNIQIITDNNKQTADNEKAQKITKKKDVMNTTAENLRLTYILAAKSRLLYILYKPLRFERRIRDNHLLK